jgi:small subunit ribosomal protein S13
MARIEGVELPSQKRIEYALPYIFGIGVNNARVILNAVGIDFNKRVKDLTNEEVGKLQKAVEGYTTEGALRKDITNNIRRLQDIGSYRGARHKKRLPCRGQRTKTNARTTKGPRRPGCAVALKRKVTKK